EANSGGRKELAERMPEILPNDKLRQIPTTDYFSTMTFRVFSAGLNQKMVRNKWPAFEEVFLGFEPTKVAFFSDDDIERLMTDTRIIRHLGKIRATHHNAQAMITLEKEYGSFGNYLADWQETDAIGLWEDLKKRFTQLGGNSGPYFLRMMGKDSFMLTPDVIRALNKLEIAAGKITAKRDRANVQSAFNEWHKETGLNYASLSRTLAIWIG
ncbi:MAG: DNA-3-methyladenine glycosylase I, partial [Sneathiella sp.]